MNTTKKDEKNKVPDLGDLLEMRLTKKEILAISAALHGVDLSRIVGYMSDVLIPLYKKNMEMLDLTEEEAIEAAAAHLSGGKDCPICGIKTSSLIDGMCHVCYDERKEYLV